MDLDFEATFLTDTPPKLNLTHFHDAIEVLVCVNGSGNIFVEKRLYPLRPGTMIVMGDSVMHRCFDLSSTSEQLVLHFTYETLEKVSSPQSKFISFFSESNRCTLLNPDQLEKIRSLFEACIRSDKETFGADVERDIAFLQLLIFICNCLESNKTEHIKPSKEFSKVLPQIQYIHTHLAEPLSLEQLSNEFFISKSHLCRTFKAATGFSVASYIINCRILKACNLLRDDVPVQEAGERVGFNNNAHFIKVFKQMVGVSPGKYAHNYNQ